MKPTKQSGRECECTCHLNPLNKTLGKVEYCSKCIRMHTICQPTENYVQVGKPQKEVKATLTVGSTTEKHDTKLCPKCNPLFTEKPIKVGENKRIAYQLGYKEGQEDEAIEGMKDLEITLAEYKQKPIKRIEERKKKKDYPLWGCCQDCFDLSLDEVEAVVREI